MAAAENVGCHLRDVAVSLAYHRTVDLTALDHVAAAAAALAAGLVNAVAGGGTLITFPTLVAIGVPTKTANITNAIALCPGYFGGTWAQREDLQGQRRRAQALAVSALVGGLAGALLLLASPDKLFRNIVPFLILGACALLGFQGRLRKLVPVRTDDGTDRAPGVGVLVATCGASVYGGYFGAGLGIMLLAVLGLLIPETLRRVNAVKQLMTFVVNITAALIFVLRGDVAWTIAAVMAPMALLGGHLGGGLAKRLDANKLRAVVVTLGVAVAVRMLTS